MGWKEDYFAGTVVDFPSTGFGESDLALKIVRDGDYESLQYSSKNLFYFLLNKGEALKTMKVREMSWLNLFDEVFAESRVPGWRWEETRQELKGEDLFPMDRKWFLRNLTTHGYVFDRSHIFSDSSYKNGTGRCISVANMLDESVYLRKRAARRFLQRRLGRTLF